MATSASQPTRQQLDDLDALLQRMLSLPVDPAEEPAPPEPPPPSAPRYPEPFIAPAGNVILSDPEITISQPPPLSRPPVPLPPEPVSLPLVNPVPPALRRGPVLPTPDRPRTPLEALAASRPPRPSLLLRPIVALNRCFDAVAFGLGAPGRWLRLPAGRTLLGLIGLLLLAVAGALFLLDRIGWTW
jgi:hypothetical protein